MQNQRTADLATAIARELMQKNGEVTIEAVRDTLEERYQIRGSTDGVAKVVRIVKEEAKKQAQQQFRRPDWPPQAETMFDALLQHLAKAAEDKFFEDRAACYAERDEVLARIQLVEQHAAAVDENAQKIEERNKLLAEKIAHLQNQLAVAEQAAALAKDDAATARSESREAREMAERRVRDAQEAADARIVAEQKAAQQQKEFWANETHRQREEQREEHARAIDAVKQQRDRLQARVDAQENELNALSRQAADANRDLAVKTGLYERLDAELRELKAANQRNVEELAAARRDLILWKQRARRAEHREARETGH